MDKVSITLIITIIKLNKIYYIANVNQKTTELTAHKSLSPQERHNANFLTDL